MCVCIKFCLALYDHVLYELINVGASMGMILFVVLSVFKLSIFSICFKITQHDNNSGFLDSPVAYRGLCDIYNYYLIFLSRVCIFTANQIYYLCTVIAKIMQSSAQIC